MLNKKIDESKLKWEKVVTPEPPYTLRVDNEDGTYRTIKCTGSIIGKETKHVRFWSKDEQTAYIRWYAPQSLRLLIADKNPKDVVYVKVETKEKKNAKGEPEKYQYITKHAITQDEGVVKAK